MLREVCERFALRICVCISLAAVAMSPLGACADDLRHGSTSKLARSEAITAIPFDKIKQPMRNRIEQIVKSASVYRRLPVASICTDPDLHLFLVRYPEVIVDIWRLMGVSRMTASRTGQYNIKADDGVGTTSEIELVYGTPNTHIYYAQGMYDGPMIMRKLTGSCVIVLQTEYRRNSAGEIVATDRLDVFMKIDNAAAGLIVKTVHPLFGTTADHNFMESLKFLEKLSETASDNGPGVQGMSQRLTNVQPQIRNRFAEIVGNVYRKSSGRMTRYDATAPLVHSRTFEPPRGQSVPAHQSSFQQPVRQPYYRIETPSR